MGLVEADLGLDKRASAFPLGGTSNARLRTTLQMACWPRAICTKGLRKEARLLCWFFRRKVEVLAYVGRVQNLKDLKGTVKPRYGLAYGGLLQINQDNQRLMRRSYCALGETFAHPTLGLLTVSLPILGVRRRFNF